MREAVFHCPLTSQNKLTYSSIVRLLTAIKHSKAAITQMSEVHYAPLICFFFWTASLIYMMLYAGHISWAYIILLCKLGEICNNEPYITKRFFLSAYWWIKNWVSVILEKGTEEMYMQFSYTRYYSFHLQHRNYPQCCANCSSMDLNQALLWHSTFLCLLVIPVGSHLTFPGPQYPGFSDSSVINTTVSFFIFLSSPQPLIHCSITSH